MKIRNIEKWTEEYYPHIEKIKRKKPRKKDLDTPKKNIMGKHTKK